MVEGAVHFDQVQFHQRSYHGIQPFLFSGPGDVRGVQYVDREDGRAAPSSGPKHCVQYYAS